MSTSVTSESPKTNPGVYTWVVTENAPLPMDVSRKIATIGPSGNRLRLGVSTVVRNGKRFKLSDAGGNLLFTGYIHGEFSGTEPLEDFGKDNGASVIEYDEKVEAR